MSAISTFPVPIRRYLGDFVARRRGVRALRALIWGVAVLLVSTILMAVADRLFALHAWLRATLVGVELLLALGLFGLALRHAFRRRVDWIAASEEIETLNASLGQRLVTVASQLLAPGAYRGSGQMLDALVEDVSARLASQRGGRLVGMGTLARPALLTLALAVGLAICWTNPWLNMPQLFARQVRPFAGIAPVTTTQIEVVTTQISVREREPAVVKAVVRNLGGGALPTLYVRTGPKQWDASVMTATGDQAYAFTLPPVEQDLRFYIRAGDAKSPTYPVRVLRRPVVAEFRIRYNYPAYTGRGGRSIHNSDGLIEAPQGSEAVVQIAATEPLTSATVKIAGKRLDTVATAEPNVRQIRLMISRDQAWEVEMTSDRGVEGRGPAGMLIRSVADRAPLVRLIQPATDLRLSPREIVPLAYQAMDDYGVANLTARAQVNANPPVEYPIRIRGDARRVEGSFDLDLAGLKVKVGDVVSINIGATDKAGQKGSSEVRHVLVSPRSIDVMTHQRLAELAQATDYAKQWADQMGKAQQAIEKARGIGTERTNELSAATAQVSRRLTAAQETGAMLRQSLYRSIMYSNQPTMSDALALAVDQTAVQLDGIDRVEEMVASKQWVDDAAVGRLTRTVAGVRELGGFIKQLAEGDQAMAVLADRGNLKLAPTTAPTDRPAKERRKQMLDRANQDIDTALVAMGIKPKDPAVDAQLQQRIDTAARLLAQVKPADYTTAALRWVAGIKGKEFQPPRLAERLASASQAESVRPDAELVAARDLQLASRAAAVLGETATADNPEAQKKAIEGLDQFAVAVTALRAEHEVNRRAQRARSLAESRKIHAEAREVHTAASAARGRLIAWAAGPGASADELAERARQAEELALAANAATQTREFDHAAELDKKLAAAVGKPELAEASNTARVIDQLSQNQEKVADQIAGADDRGAANLAVVQQQLADRIARAADDPAGAQSAEDSSETRQRTSEAISRVQERLALLPGQLEAAQRQALTLAEAAARLSNAKTQAGNPGEVQRETAQRVLSMVQGEVDEAQRRFAAAARPLGGKACDELLDLLRPFIPVISAAMGSIEQQLRPALAELNGALAQAAEGGDAAAIDKSANAGREAIKAAQLALRAAQSQVIDSDPLVAARLFSKRAAADLSSGNFDLRALTLNVNATSEALFRLSSHEERRSKNSRLSNVPSYAGAYAPQIPNPWGESESRNSGERLLQTIPGLREWGRLRERMGDSVTAPMRESEPAGYSEPLRVYFEVLGREDAKPREPKP